MATTSFLLNRALEIRDVEPNTIVVDYGIQMRQNLNADVVEDYASVFIEAGGWGDFPPIILFQDADGLQRLGDGFHRLAGWKQAGIKGPIPANVKQGGWRDARLFAIGANKDHGLRRTRDDIQKAVMTLLRDEEWSQWSDRQLADIAGVSHTTISNARRSLAKVASDNAAADKAEPVERRYITKHGTEGTMKVPQRPQRPSGPGANLKPGESLTVSVPQHTRTYVAPAAPADGEGQAIAEDAALEAGALPADWDWEEVAQDLRRAQERLQAIAIAAGLEVVNMNFDPKMVAGSWFVEGIAEAVSMNAYSSALSIAVRNLYDKATN